MEKTISADDARTTPADLERQAWDWLDLMKSGEATTADADRFRQWVSAHPRHQAAYAQARSQWKTVASTVGRWRHGNQNVLTIPPSVSRPSRRLFLGVAGGAVAAAAAGVAIAYPPLGLWPTPSEWGADYRTATGEQRTIALARHVQVTLNTQTSIRRDIQDSTTVGLELVSGELAVDMDQAERSFTVAAGAGRSAADSGQFSVRNLQGKVCVTCIKGTVRIAHPAGEHLLAASEQAVYDDRDISVTAGADPATATAWRQGMLVFHETRLADAIAEINRYRAGRIVLMNATVRDERVDGTFRITALDQTVMQLQQAYGLRARALGDLLILS